MSFGGIVLPHVAPVSGSSYAITQTKARVFYEVVIPNAQFDYRTDLGGKGTTFAITGWVQSTDPVSKAQIQALADGTARILDLQDPYPQSLDKVWYYQSTPAWTDDTAEAQSGGGTAFTVLAASTDYMYFGSFEMFNLLQFVFGTFGSYGTLTWQYSQGGGVWAALTVTDGTSGFTQNGNVTFTPPTVWAQDTVNNVGNRFWVRVSAASVTTLAKALQILLNPCYNCILLDPQFTADPTAWNQWNFALTFQQIYNP